METSATLPDGRLLALDPAAADRLRAGVLVLTEVAVAERPAVWRETEALARRLRGEYAGLAPSAIPVLGEARRLYRSFGMDPSRHRPSNEALLRRVLQGKELYHISNVVDSCNLVSLGCQLPIGLYDLDLVRGDVVLRTGRPGEEYEGIRKGMVHLAGRLGLFDAEGPFGSPTSDSARTCTRETTTRLLAVILATADYPARGMAENLDLFARTFNDHCGAREVFRAVLGGS